LSRLFHNDGSFGETKPARKKQRRISRRAAVYLAIVVDTHSNSRVERRMFEFYQGRAVLLSSLRICRSRRVNADLIEEDRIAGVAAQDHMEKGAGVMDSGVACQRRRIDEYV
jgi:hypothetical protein